MSYIYEFPHPRFVVNYDPDPDLEPYDFTVLDEALQYRAHAIELHALYRDSDATVVWAHDSDYIADSKPLTQAIDYVLARMVGQTMYGDGLQFFFALTPHMPTDLDLLVDESRLSRYLGRLLDGLYALMSQYAPYLSTAVTQGDVARGITFIVSGLSQEFRARHSGGDTNRLCIVEGVDYTRNSEITSLNDQNPSFQWMLYEHSHERGKVNPNHCGDPGLFNVRVWDADDDQRLALASGVDSVNARPGDNIRNFKEILLHQKPRGASPCLAVSDGQLALTWRGDSSDDNLYVALGSISLERPKEIKFSRQINLTWFLKEKPRAIAPAAAFVTATQLIIVYEGTHEQRLWYVSGSFTRPDRFLTFSGQQERLTLPHDSGRRGSNPSVAVAPDGRVIKVYEGTDAERLWYVSGYVQDGIVEGPEYHLTEGKARRGHTPAIAIDAAGNVLVVYRGTDKEKLWYVSGQIDPQNGKINGYEFPLTQGSSRRGFDPSVAFAPDGHVLIAYEGTDDQRLWYVYGYLDSTGQIIGAESELTDGAARKGTQPTASFDSNGNATILYSRVDTDPIDVVFANLGTHDAKLWYVRGRFDAGGRPFGQEQLLDMSLGL